MKTNKILKSIASVLILTSLIFTSCTKDNFEQGNNSLEQQEQVLEITPVVQKLLDMGYAIETIIETDNFYIAGGDLFFSKNIKEYLVSQETTQARGQTQTGTYRYDPQHLFPTLEDGDFINVFSGISSNVVGDPWTDAVNLAISDLNAGNCIDMRLVHNESIANIKIFAGDANFPDDVFGRERSPDGGGYHSEITINLNFENGATSDNQKRTIIAHELGHAIGFKHIEDTMYPEIPGIIAGPNSIMIENIINRDDTIVGLIANDIEAIDYLYDDCNSDDGNDGNGNDDNPIITCPTNLELFTAANCEDAQAWINAASGVDYVDFYYTIGSYNHVYFGTSQGNQSNQFAAPLYMPDPPSSGSWNGYTLSVYAVAVMDDDTICDEIVVRERLSCSPGNWW